MPLFRKKPVVIEARQLIGSDGVLAPPSWREIAEWCGGTVFELPDIYPHMTIPTLEGLMTAGAGDWVIKGTKNEFYPCKQIIFPDLYEECTYDGLPGTALPPGVDPYRHAAHLMSRDPEKVIPDA